MAVGGGVTALMLKGVDRDGVAGLPVELAYQSQPLSIKVKLDTFNQPCKTVATASDH